MTQSATQKAPKVGDKMPYFDKAIYKVDAEIPWLGVGNLGKMIFYKSRKTSRFVGGEAYRFCHGEFDELPFAVWCSYMGQLPATYLDNSPTDGKIDSIRGMDNPVMFIQEVAPECPEIKRFYFE